MAKNYISWNHVVIHLAFQRLPKFGQNQQRVGDNLIIVQMLILEYNLFTGNTSGPFY